MKQNEATKPIQYKPLSIKPKKNNKRKQKIKTNKKLLTPPRPQNMHKN